jgi:hypothetical protein
MRNDAMEVIIPGVMVGEKSHRKAKDKKEKKA